MERVSSEYLAFGILAAFLFLTAACATEGSKMIVCSPGESLICPCSNGFMAKKVCLPDGSGFGECQCVGPAGSGSDTEGLGDMSAATVAGYGANDRLSVAGSGVGGQNASGTGGLAAGSGGRGAGVTPMDAGLDGNTGTDSPSTTAGTGSNAGSAGTAGAASASDTTNPATDDLEEVRQLCVDTINNLRSTMSLPPLARAPANVEACSDEGAKQDGESGVPHGSAGNCSAWRLAGSPLQGGQNTCPGYRVGGWGGMGSTLGEVLVFCLNQMWAEGEPPQGRAACMQDYAGCFMQHGHYINMTDTTYRTVSCGFYDMGNNTWWMNQDF